MKQSLEAMTLAVVAGKGNLGSPPQAGPNKNASDALKGAKEKGYSG
jgi:hypothetical protein